MRSERRFDEALRQRESDLTQILGVCAQDDDVYCRQPCSGNQAVEIVVLDFAAKNLSERFFENRVKPVDVEVMADQRALDTEVMHPYRFGIFGRQFVRPLIEHIE